MLNFKELAENILTDLMNNGSISEILLKTKIFADKRGDKELLEWANHELEGYEEKPPKYRILNSGLRVVVHVPYQGNARIDFPLDMIENDDARERLTEIAERNVRYGDEFAFMAMRTIWCIMSRYEHEGSKVDIEQLEKDMLSFHEGNEYLKANDIEQIFYNYSVRKMVKYIQFLNEFRRYSDYESIREDLQSIPVSHCSSNDPQYYYSFYKGTLFNVWHILLEEWNNVTKNGKLDNALLEQVAFGRFDNMVKEHGLKETIRLAYGEVGCHPDIQAPRMREEGRVWGPVYRIDGKHIEKGCSDFRRWPWTNTSFEMKFAREILERDKNYMCVDTDWRGALYLPLSDYTLPVYSLQLGKMHFESQEEKIKFIEDHKTGRNAD